MPEIALGNHFTNVTDSGIKATLSRLRNTTKLNIIIEQHDEVTGKIFKKTTSTYTVYLKISDVESQVLSPPLNKSNLFWFLKGFHIGAVNELKS